MSEVKVNKISPRTNCGTVQLGDSGDTITIPAGATITNNGTQTGFGRTGAVDWDTTAKTASFTAVNGEGYFINSASSAITVTLPASPSAGNIVSVSDYNNTAETNKVTIARNGSNINGNASDLEISKNGTAVELVYVDSTTGWQSVATANTSDILNPFIIASGGTETTCGDFKIHTFTSPGTFTVSSGGTTSGSNTVSYMVVAGGGGGAPYRGGGGGAGGFRESKASTDTYTASPLNATSGPGYDLPVTVQAYPITVGGGGAINTEGANSIFSTITSTGGGSGGGASITPGRLTGGSGGGENTGGSGGAGNTPPVSPAQGTDGGAGGPSPGSPHWGAGGGGGAIQAGSTGGPSGGGPGGNGTSTSITGSSVTRAGGGAGGGIFSAPTATGGSGGGGPSPTNSPGVAGTTNTGGGGGGANSTSDPTQNAGAAGGSGIVVIRYKYQ